MKINRQSDSSGRAASIWIIFMERRIHSKLNFTISDENVMNKFSGSFYIYSEALKTIATASEVELQGVDWPGKRRQKKKRKVDDKLLFWNKKSTEEVVNHTNYKQSLCKKAIVCEMCLWRRLECKWFSDRVNELQFLQIFVETTFHCVL